MRGAMRPQLSVGARRPSGDDPAKRIETVGDIGRIFVIGGRQTQTFERGFVKRVAGRRMIFDRGDKSGIRRHADENLIRIAPVGIAQFGFA